MVDGVVVTVTGEVRRAGMVGEGEGAMAVGGGGVGGVGGGEG